MRWKNKLLSYLVEQNCIKEEDRELYAYGLQLTGMIFINILVSVALGIVLELLPYLLVFLVFFIPLRSFAGGYHARTAAGCAVQSQFILILAAWTAKSILKSRENWQPLPVLFFLYGAYQIIRRAPGESENKLLEPEEKIRYRKTTIRIAMAELGIVFVGYAAGHYGIPIIISCVFLTEGLLLFLQQGE